MPATTTLEKLLHFALAHQLLERADICFARNALLSAMGMNTPEELSEVDDGPLPQTVTPLLESLAAIAVSRGIIEDSPFDRDQFGARLMNLVSLPPSQVIERFATIRAREGAEAATTWLHTFCCDNDAIRVDQIAQNDQINIPSEYGELEITINLSKPEKDPKEIAKLKNAAPVGYPRCMLCVENEGYAGRLGYPSHETLRTIPLTLCGEAWRLQYSPYAYYNEHCIALNEQHIPMAISRKTLEMLLAVVDQLPHYFFGSNADLPIVGGSILNHDHFQGGRHLFPMEKAPAYASFRHEDYPGLAIEIVRWPMTCVRISAAIEDKAQLIDCFVLMLETWRGYDDVKSNILHQTVELAAAENPGRVTAHNTITPIVRRTPEGRYILHLVLRNNRTTGEHPLGLFHPHADLHHIKRENIGLIEVMGRFILPGRLARELPMIRPYLTGDRKLTRPDKNDPMAQHYDWAVELAEKHGVSLTESAAQRVLHDALGRKCVRVLEDAGVFKQNPEGIAALRAFLSTCSIRPCGASNEPPPVDADGFERVLQHPEPCLARKL